MAPTSRSLAVLQSALAIALIFWQPPSASSLDVALPKMIVTEYQEPADPKLRPYYEELKRRHALERLQGFMVALKLHRPLIVHTAQCGAETMPYKPGGAVTICYELVRHIAAVAAGSGEDPKVRAQILFGTFVQAMLHQLAYAVFNDLEVPIWGRQADAADNIAAFIMMQFGEKIALTTILGAAKFFEDSGRTWTGTDFASTGSPDAQRFYNYLCMAYGADPVTFSFLIVTVPRPGYPFPVLPNDRAVRCENEYLRVKQAFNLRIMPFVDPELLIKVRASQWLLSDETP